MQKRRGAAEEKTRPSDRHRVRKGIQSLILSGKAASGSKLVQMDLARRYGVTQNVVREALLELQSCGLVEARDNRGVFVGELTPRKFLEYLDVRAALEGLVASLCCEYITRAEIRRLKETAEAIRKAGKENRIEDDIALDKEFHHSLLQVSKNGILAQIIETYWPLARILSAQAEPDTTFREHMAIIHAIEKGSPQDAEQRMRDHIINSKHLIEERIKDGSFEPLWLKPKKLKEKDS